MAFETIFRLVFMSFLLKCINCANILAIFPIPFKEHQLLYRPLLETLALRGHDILLLTTDPINFNQFNNNSISDRIEQIDLSFVYNLNILDKLNDNNLDGSEMLKNVFDVMRKLSEAELKHESVQSLINNSNEYKFDVVIVEWSGVTLMNAFSHKFNVPLIGITNAGAFINAHEALGNPNHPIGYPSIFMPFSENLNLLQRISSVIFTVWYRFYYYTEEIPQQNLVAKEHFGDDLPDLWDIENTADLLLINSYQALGNVRPVGPTTIYLGGIHQQLKKRELPVDLELFITQSDGPVIYVNLNLGSVYRLDKIINALEKQSASIIWHWNDGDLINTTSRIYQSYNLPQENILGHPKVSLFVTDGGQRNVEDAIHHQVPVLGISYSTSLEHYLRQIEKYDAGIISLIDFETQSTLTDKIASALKNEMYSQNMKNLNRLILDQPMLSSMDRATWWIEYVIRNKGTKHLQAPKLSWFHYLMLDVALTVLCLSCIMVCVVACIINKMILYSKSLPFEMVTRGSRKCKVL